MRILSYRVIVSEKKGLMVRSDKANLSLIYEASIQQQRALMKEIRRRREAGAQPMTPAEQEAIVNKKEEKIWDHTLWCFDGVGKILALVKDTRTKVIGWRILEGMPRRATSIRIEEDPMNPKSILQVMRNVLIPYFEEWNRDLWTYDTFQEQLAKLNGNIHFSPSTLAREQTCITLETTPYADVIDMSSVWSVMNIVAPNIYRVRVDSDYYCKQFFAPAAPPGTIITDMKTVLLGVLYRAPLLHNHPEGTLSMAEIIDRAINDAKSNNPFFSKDARYETKERVIW